MKKLRVLLLIMLTPLLFIGCSNNSHEMALSESKGIIFEPPDYPAEFEHVLLEYESTFEKAQSDSSYKALLSEKELQLYKIAEKYNIEILTDEELNSSLFNSSVNRSVSDLGAWLNSIWGYYHNGAAYVYWEIYNSAKFYQIYQKVESRWILWATLKNPSAVGFINRSARQFNIRCTNTSNQTAAKDISV